MIYMIHNEWRFLLLQSNYQHPFDYVTYTWLPVQRREDVGDGTDMYDLVIDQTYLTDMLGTFCLCYYSSTKDSIMGVSDIFKVRDYVLLFLHMNDITKSIDKLLNILMINDKGCI